MPFNRDGLCPVGGQSKAGNAPQMWSYMTDDAAADVDTTGYFNSVAGLLRVGDLILRVTMSTGSVSTVGWHVVTSNASGVVDVTDTVAISVATDTD